MGRKTKTIYLREPGVSPDPISLVVWNVGGPSAGKGTASKRKRVITGLLESKQPSLVLVQEFSWIKIKRHNTWKDAHITDRYEYIRHKEAGILYDKNKLEVINLTEETEIRTKLDEMIRKKKLPQGFTPLGRMVISEIKTKAGPKTHFLCVSWHGSHNSRKKADLLEEFKNLLVFMEAIEDHYDLPLLIGGDFNLQYKDIPEKFKNSGSGLIAYMYDPLKRRRSRLIDFYIGSSTLPLSKIAPVDLEKVDKGEDAQKIFDHDPVEATLMTHAKSLSGSSLCYIKPLFKDHMIVYETQVSQIPVAKRLSTFC